MEGVHDDSEEVNDTIASNDAGPTGRKEGKTTGAASFVMKAAAHEVFDDDAELLSSVYTFADLGRWM